MGQGEPCLCLRSQELSRKTLENFLGIRISNYVLVDFQGFIKLVDAIGGVDIDVEKAMQYTDPTMGKRAW